MTKKEATQLRATEHLARGIKALMKSREVLQEIGMEDRAQFLSGVLDQIEAMIEEWLEEGD